MKKRMFLSTILMTLVLLVSVTTATFAWYTSQLNTSKQNVTLVTAKNATSTTSMTAAIQVIGLNGAAAPKATQSTTGTDITVTDFTIPGMDTLGFLPVVTTLNTDFNDKKGTVAGQNELAKANATAYSDSNNDWHTFVYDGTENYTIDPVTQGLAAIKVTLTIEGKPEASDQQLTLTMSCNESATLWGLAYEYTMSAGKLYSVNSAATEYENPVGMAGYATHEVAANQNLLAKFCAPKDGNLSVVVVIWLNGCATSNTTPITESSFSFELKPAAASDVVALSDCITIA